MVAITNDHDHGDGEACPGCRFKAALAEHLEHAADEGGEAWVYTTGEVVELMGTAIAALSRLRNARFENDAADDGSAMEAAAAISRLGGAIEELWHMLLGDERDDHGVGL